MATRSVSPAIDRSRLPAVVLSVDFASSGAERLKSRTARWMWRSSSPSVQRWLEVSSSCRSLRRRLRIWLRSIGRSPSWAGLRFEAGEHGVAGGADGGVQRGLGVGLLLAAELVDGGGEVGGDGDLLQVQEDPRLYGERGPLVGVGAVDLRLQAGEGLVGEVDGELGHGGAPQLATSSWRNPAPPLLVAPMTMRRRPTAAPS